MKTIFGSTKSLFSLFALCLLFSAQISNADPNLPTGFTPISGNLSASQTANTLNVTAGSNNSIVNWNTFNIGSGYTVNMQLPGANSAILNRVIGNNPSSIFGTLKSNGRVLLINENGILFGPMARVNVGSLMASTLNISNANFLAGNYLFKQLGSAASIVNKGDITAASGVVNLFAGAIENSGTITADNGQVNLAVGQEVAFTNRNGTGFLVYVDQKLIDKVAGFNDAIKNTGTIQANAGLVKLQAQLENDLYQYAVNTSGSVIADRAANVDGHIQFISSGDVLNKGTVSASGSGYIQGNSLQNNGSISAGNDLGIKVEGLKTITRSDPDGSLIHSPDGSSDFNLFSRPVQTLSFSLLNNPNASITAGNDLTINAQNIFNTSGTIEAGRDLGIKASLLVNERAGFYTEYIPWRGGIDGPSPYLPGTFERSDEESYYAYWIDRASGLPEAYLGAGRDLKLLVERTVNANSLLEAGRDLQVEGGSFVNAVKVLQGTQARRWKGAGFLGSRNKQFFGAPFSLAGSYSSVLVGNDANFKLTGNFNNASMLDVSGDLAVEAQNVNIGILDNRIQTPNPVVLAPMFVVPFWADIPKDFAGFEALTPESRAALARALRSYLFNQTGKAYFGHEFMSADGTLAWLLANAKAALLADPSLVFGKKLTQKQINKLEKPILWVEEDENGNRHIVVYVPDQYGDISSPEGLVQANNIKFDVQDKFYNSGTVVAKDNLTVNANEIVNEARTVKRSAVVRENKGMFRGNHKTVYFDEIQRGGNLSGDNVNLNANKSVTNRGGTVIAENALKIIAPEVTNEAQRGTELITWKSSFADKLIGGAKTYSLKPTFQGGLLSGKTVEITSPASLTGGANTGSFRNVGSDVHGDEKVSIKGFDTVENSWIAESYTTKDSRSVKGLSVNRDTTTGHVTQGASIASGEDVEIDASHFRNVAADVIASENITVIAGTIDITDDTLRSVDKHTSTGIKFSLPATVSINHQDTRNTHSTHQSSNLVAGRELKLESEGNLTVTGSNLMAGEKLDLKGNKVTIQNGLYTDTTKTIGGSASAGIGVGTINLGATVFKADGSAQTLTQSNLIGKNVSINGSNEVNLKASNVHGSESVEITTPKLDVTGEYQRQAYKSQSHGVTVSITLPQFAAAAAIANTTLGTVLDKVAPNQAAAGSSGGGKAGIGVSYSQSNSHNNSGQYVMSNISSPKLTINAPSQHIDGAVINDKVINPSNNHDYHDSGSTSFGFGVGTGGFNANIGSGNHSFGLGVGNSGLFGSVGYKDFNIGSSLNPGTGRVGLFGGAYGVNGSLGFTGGSGLFDAGASYGPIGIGGTFGNGHLKVGGTFGFWNADLIDYAKSGNTLPIDQTAERVELIDQTLTAVDKVRNTQNLSSGELEALNEIEQQLKAAKTIELTYGTDNSRQISNALINSAGNLIPTKLPDEALAEMSLSAQRLRLQLAHDIYSGLSNIPIVGIGFGAIDSFIYANQGTAYPGLNGVGINNQQNYNSLLTGTLSSLPLPGGKLVEKSIVRGIKGLIKRVGLPITGKIRFIPKDGWSLSNGLVKGNNGGYLDKFGNEWIRPKGQIINKPHWDVQLSDIGKKMLGNFSKSGSHLNVTKDGRISHF
jgi:filamentous hemagglutinin family protein